MNAPWSGQRHVRLSTVGGDMIIAVETARAPATAAYFLHDVATGIYDNSTIFRISTLANQDLDATAPIEIVQGGTRQPNEPVFPYLPHESTRDTGLRHRRGTISLSRFAPGAVYHSFFLCRRDEPALDFGGARQPDGLGFPAFGSVVEGLDVLDGIFGQAEGAELLERRVPIFKVALL